MPSNTAHPLRFALRLGARASIVALAYVAAAAAILLTVIGLRGLIAPAALQRFLGFVFIASLAAGLEPGTAKAAALRADGMTGVGAILGAGALKALACAPVLAIIWRFADREVPLAVLALTPAIAVAGFCATDLRVLLDLRGQYARAIGLKQGSLAGGIALAGALTAAGLDPLAAIGLSTLARLAFLAVLAGMLGAGEGAAGRPLAPMLGGLLADSRWMDLAAASVIATASGSADRLFGLRFLSPAAYGGYFLVNEVFSKFWLIPYVLSPIIFARQVAGQSGRAFMRGAAAFTAVAGLAFLAAVAALMFLLPDLLARFAGASFGPVTLAFCAAVVVTSFTQLRIAQLQGEGAARRAAVVMALSAVFSVALFYLAAQRWGAAGLLGAWLVKSVVELGAAMVPVPAGARRPS